MKLIEIPYLRKRIFLSGYSEDDWIYKAIDKSKCFYELDLLEYVRFVLRDRKGLILDVGANIGNHSVYFGLFAGQAVASFEPNPSVSSILEKNLVANFVNHKVFKFGLGSQQGSFCVEMPMGMANNVGAARLTQSVDGTVEVKKLDDVFPETMAFFQGIPFVAIKADIEGMEADMLRGAIETLRTHKPDLFLEINTSQSMGEILKILEPMGYKKIVSWAATPVWHFVHKSKYNLCSRLRVWHYIFVNKIKNSLL